MKKMLHHNMNRFKKRERTQNWAYEEKRFLLELCRKDMKIIENKRLDSSLTSLKNKAWRIIHTQFTATFGTDRDCNRLKEQWRRMKACTRAEMMDYQHRQTRYGNEIADRKRPSPFSFEIWEFMQEAKRCCKSEAMDDVDYSKMKLSLEVDLPDGVIMDDEEDGTMWSYLREKSTQNICEVEIKEEAPNDDDEEYNYSNNNNNNISSNNNNNSSSNHNGKHRNSHNNNNSLDEPPKKQRNTFKTNYVSEFCETNQRCNETQPSLSINNVSATLDTLNLLKNQMNRKHQQQQRDEQPASSINNNNNSSFNNNNNNNIDDNTFKQYLDMQKREHLMRMQILQVELETAKFNRDTAEINRQLLLKKFNDTNIQETSS